MASETADLDLGEARSIVAALEPQGEGGRFDPDNLIPLLQRIQDSYGYLPLPVMRWVSERTKIPTSRMYGVATFYGQFYLEPHGKHTVRCCRGTACHVRGGNKVINTVRQTLGIGEGETTEDMMFSFETVACLGACAISPVMVLDKSCFGHMTPREAERVLQQFVQEEE